MSCYTYNGPIVSLTLVTSAQLDGDWGGGLSRQKYFSSPSYYLSSLQIVEIQIKKPFKLSNINRLNYLIKS